MRQEINNIETNKEEEAQFTDSLCAQEQGRHATGWTNKGSMQGRWYHYWAGNLDRP